MSEKIEGQLLRLQSVVMIQSAEISALLLLLSSLFKALELPSKGPEKEFAKARKRFLETQLLQLEKANLSLAAKIQEMLDGSCTNQPFDHEG